MAGGRRRHLRRRSPWALELLAYGVVGLGAGTALATYLGVPWWQAALGAAGLLAVLLIAVLLERTGLMRLTHLDDDPRDD